MLCLFCVLTAALGSGCAVRDTSEHTRRAHEKLNGVLWMQSSAEYHASARQAFALASLRLEQALGDTRWSAALEQSEGFERLPPAVVVDVDETVLDNAPFQALMVERAQSFDRELWREWVQTERSRAVPGAADFVRLARERGVRVFYVTNRVQEAPTLENLRRELDPAVTTEELMVRRERPEWGSDKASRRAEVARSHRILLLVGDDYNDFASLGGDSPDQRVARAGEHRARWGVQWIVLPNPLYGSFERAFYGHESGLPDRERLKSKYESLRAVRLPSTAH